MIVIYGYDGHLHLRLGNQSKRGISDKAPLPDSSDANNPLDGYLISDVLIPLEKLTSPQVKNSVSLPQQNAIDQNAARIQGHLDTIKNNPSGMESENARYDNISSAITIMRDRYQAIVVQPGLAEDTKKVARDSLNSLASAQEAMDSLNSFHNEVYSESVSVESAREEIESKSDPFFHQYSVRTLDPSSSSATGVNTEESGSSSSKAAGQGESSTEDYGVFDPTEMPNYMDPGD